MRRTSNGKVTPQPLLNKQGDKRGMYVRTRGPNYLRVKELHVKGLSLRGIAKILGITPGRVHQIIQAQKEEMGDTKGEHNV